MFDASERPTGISREGIGGKQEKFQTGICDIGTAVSRQAHSLVNDPSVKNGAKISSHSLDHDSTVINIGPIRTYAISDDIRAKPVPARCHWYIKIPKTGGNSPDQLDMTDKSNIARMMLWDDGVSEKVSCNYLPAPNSDIIAGIKWVHGLANDPEQFMLEATPKGASLHLGKRAIGSLIGDLPTDGDQIQAIQVEYNGSGELAEVRIKLNNRDEFIRLSSTQRPGPSVGKFSLEDADQRSSLPRKVLRMGDAQIEITTMPSHIDLQQIILGDDGKLIESLYEHMENMPDVGERFFTNPVLGKRYAYQIRINEAGKVREQFASDDLRWSAELDRAASFLRDVGLSPAANLLGEAKGAD